MPPAAGALGMSGETVYVPVDGDIELLPDGVHKLSSPLGPDIVSVPAQHLAVDLTEPRTVDERARGIESHGPNPPVAHEPGGPVLASLAVPSENQRTVISFTAITAWLTLLLVGLAFGGAVHLLLALALLTFPWRRLRD